MREVLKLLSIFRILFESSKIDKRIKGWIDDNGKLLLIPVNQEHHDFIRQYLKNTDNFPEYDDYRTTPRSLTMTALKDGWIRINLEKTGYSNIFGFELTRDVSRQALRKLYDIVATYKIDKIVPENDDLHLGLTYGMLAVDFLIKLDRKI